MKVKLKLKDRPIKRDLTTGEAARLLGYSEKTVRTMLEAGAFPNARRWRPGAVWRIPVADIEALLESSRAAVVKRKR